MATVAGATHAATRRQCRCVATVRKAGPATLPLRPARRPMLCRRTLAGLPGGSRKGGTPAATLQSNGGRLPPPTPREASAVRPPPLYPLPRLPPLPCPYPDHAPYTPPLSTHHACALPLLLLLAVPGLALGTLGNDRPVWVSHVCIHYTLYILPSLITPPLITPPQITPNQLRHLVSTPTSPPLLPLSHKGKSLHLFPSPSLPPHLLPSPTTLPGHSFLTRRGGNTQYTLRRRNTTLDCWEE